jgi:phosphate uptake regulator
MLADPLNPGGEGLTMLKELLAAWRGRDALAQMFDEFDQMLDHNHWMFQQAVEVFFSRVDWQAVQDPLYTRDKEVNSLEQSIRTQVVKHLTIRPEANLPACLMLMSVVKDAERIGDYCKNIFEVGKFYTREFTTRRYLDPLEAVRAKVERLFTSTQEAFGKSDVPLARAALKDFEGLSLDCDALVHMLLQEHDHMHTDEAVAYGLLTRHMKRIGAHLANIATAVVAPVHMLDYADEAQPGEMS